MAMAALSFSPAISILDLSSPRRLPSLVVACSARAGKARVSRKAMSDSDLCKGLHDFVSSVGFPEGHVPSTKQLAEHGRKDLANIVRRRGHKAVKGLLANSTSVANKSEVESCLTEGQNIARYFEDDATGEKTKVKELTQEALDMMQGVSSFVNESKMKFGSDVHLDDKFGMPIGSPNGSSIEEKVEKFLKYGSLDLDILEDDIGHNLRVNVAEGSRGYKENSTVSNAAIHDQRDSSVTRNKTETLVLNGTAVMSNAIANPVPGRNKMRDNDAYLESPAGSAFSRDMNFETSDMENQDEAERLKNILQQKELEICQLRELIEKEKHALSTLQSKAEEEIRNAQKLISEMDAELLAAEESLAGLKEVQIQYMEEAQMVEIAGSFNGWHQPIKMDPHPDTGKDPIKSRNPRLWYISLWLYPGEYEVKFIVDGEWKVDPEREITTRSGMHNNILRVDG